MRVSRLLGVWLLLALCLPPPGWADGPVPLQALVDEVRLSLDGGARLSPDGEWITYTTSDPQRSLTTESPSQDFTTRGVPLSVGATAPQAWVTSLRTGQSIRLGKTGCNSWGGAWSPKGDSLAYYSDQSGTAGLWIWDRTTRRTHQVSPVVVHPYWATELPVWNRTGTTILCKVLPANLTIPDILRLNPLYRKGGPPGAHDTSGPTVQVFPFQELMAIPTDALRARPTADARFLSDLALFDVHSGRLTRLVKRIRPVWYAFSPDGTQVAYTQHQGWDLRVNQPRFALEVYSLRTRRDHTLADNLPQEFPGYGRRVTWSPDSSRLAFCSQESDTAEPATQQTCLILNVQGHAPITSPAFAPIGGGTLDLGRPLWSPDGRFVYVIGGERLWKVDASGSGVTALSPPDLNVERVLGHDTEYWSPDGGKTMLATGHSAGHPATVCRLDSTGSAPQTVMTTDLECSLCDAAGQHVVFTGFSGVHPTELWQTDPTLAVPRPVTHLNPALEHATLGQPQLIDFTSRQGDKLHAALLLPPASFKAPYPTVVWMYGGSHVSRAVNVFGFWEDAPEFNMQVLASRGYAVLYPDIPMHVGSPMQDVYDAVMPAVDRTIEMGFADPNRLALMGQSFGGYNVIGLITQTPRFKAAITSSAAPTNLFAGYSVLDANGADPHAYYETGQGRMGGTPWQYPARYHDNSPFFFLDKVTTPLLYEHGALDGEGDTHGAVYVALKRLNKPVEYLLYQDEGHVLARPANVLDFWNRRLEWLDRYLTPPASAPGGRQLNTP